MQVFCLLMTGVGNLRLWSHIRLFISSKVALWISQNLEFISLILYLSWLQFSLRSYEVAWKIKPHQHIEAPTRSYELEDEAEWLFCKKSCRLLAYDVSVYEYVSYFSAKPTPPQNVPTKNLTFYQFVVHLL